MKRMNVETDLRPSLTFKMRLFMTEVNTLQVLVIAIKSPVFDITGVLHLALTQPNCSFWENDKIWESK